MLSGSITSLTHITLQSHTGELRRLDFGCFPLSIQRDLRSSPAICKRLVTRPWLRLFFPLGCHLKSSYPSIICRVYLNDQALPCLQGLDQMLQPFPCH
uniref:Uncharacterized protein n=1 Tax=Calidris pygmaea TaxID=425635 RepID=A0A8C3PIB0_9CHAR